jgi:hypothetical protein
VFGGSATATARAWVDADATMPHFYMNIRRVDGFIEDLEGEQFSSLAEARLAAINSAREIMAAAVRLGKTPNHSAFEITDEGGRILLTVRFSEAIEEG